MVVEYNSEGATHGPEFIDPQRRVTRPTLYELLATKSNPCTLGLAPPHRENQRIATGGFSWGDISNNPRHNCDLLTHSFVLRVQEPAQKPGAIAVPAQHLALATAQPARLAHLEAPVEMVLRVEAVALALRAQHHPVPVAVLAIQAARLPGGRCGRCVRGLAAGAAPVRGMHPHHPAGAGAHEARARAHQHRAMRPHGGGRAVACSMEGGGECSAEAQLRRRRGLQGHHGDEGGRGMGLKLARSSAMSAAAAEC